MRRALLATLALCGTAAAEPNDAVFRARNPEPAWTTVALDPQGFVNRVATSDPAFEVITIDSTGHYQYADAALTRVRALLRSNADLFGIDAADADRVTPVGYHDTATGFTLVSIQIARGSTGGVDITVKPRIRTPLVVTRDAVAARFVGHAYNVRERVVSRPVLDCQLNHRSRSACRAQTVVTRSRLAITSPEVVEVAQGRLVIMGVQHLVHCVDLGQSARATWRDRGQSSTQVRAIDGGPKLPFVIDAVTGSTLRLSEASCAEIWERYAR